jgi:thymidylate synthase
MSHTFEALYYPELLQPVNPTGDVGLLTLWSPLESAARRLDSISPELLDGAGSRVVVMANLYGDGMYAMFCNLLFNPQVRHLIAIGEELGLPTCREIEAFIADGLEDTELLGMPAKRIVGTERVFSADPEFDEDRLRGGLSFRYLGKLSSASLGAELSNCLRELPRSGEREPAGRLRVDTARFAAREHSYRPSELTAHQVVRRRPLQCWEELVVRAVRFGRPVTLRNGPRLELLNVETVVTEPAEESEELLRGYGFSLQKFREYQEQMLDPELPEDTRYTYGNRLRGHYDLAHGTTDTLQAVIDELRANPQTRHAYISLWDTPRDLALAGDQRHPAGPCLVTLNFRRHGGALSLSAGYRAHNLLIAWLENVYGLMAIQRHVAERLELSIGPITVISHSLAIDPRSTRFELARTIEERWKRDDDRDPQTGKYSLREDPNGYFVVSVDHEAGLIVAEHRFEGVLLGRYSGRHADRIAREISADMGVSLVSHALWLGTELASKEAILRAGAAASAARQPGRGEA